MNSIISVGFIPLEGKFSLLASLPKEINEIIFEYLACDPRARFISKYANQLILNHAQERWDKLKGSADVDLTNRLSRIGSACPQFNYIKLFKRIAWSFCSQEELSSCFKSFCNDRDKVTGIGYLSDTIILKIHQKLNDEGLVNLWNALASEKNWSLSECTDVKLSDSLPNQIRSWLYSEENKEKIQKINSIKIVNGKLNYVPPEIGLFENATEIKFTGNHIDYISTEIGKLKKLRKVELYEEGLNSLPIEIINLPQLETVYVSRKLFDSLPKSFDELKAKSILLCYSPLNRRTYWI